MSTLKINGEVYLDTSHLANGETIRFPQSFDYHFTLKLTEGGRDVFTDIIEKLPGEFPNYGTFNTVLVDVAEPVEAGRMCWLSHNGKPIPIGFTPPFDLELGDKCAVRTTDGKLMSVWRDGNAVEFGG